MKQNPLLMIDGYKSSHHKMYPQGTTMVYSNFTPRSVKLMDVNAKDIVVFGQQYVMKYLHELFQNNFFNEDKVTVVTHAKHYLSSYLNSEYDVTHFEKLWDLGYLPIKVKALDEGIVIQEKIPTLTIYNTHPDFYWLPNFLETIISSLIWKPLHSASIAFAFKKIFMKYAKETDKNNIGFVNFQGHDFSFRGMQHPESAISSGLGFLTSFMGTDTVPTLAAAEHYYNTTNAGFSVPASEHSVMCSYGKEDELAAFKRILEVYPTGIVSVVSDSFDLWQVCTTYLTELKDIVMARDGKLVIRPDSGDPVDIICGAKWGISDEDGQYYREGDLFEREGDGDVPSLDIHKSGAKPLSVPERKGVIELLWDIFGGTINEQGYKVLDPHIGAILGDGVNLQRANEICKRLKAKGFATTNMVYGIGSYSMGYATRDNQGGAVKSTYVEVNGEGREIFKDPITDDGLKKSARGLVKVEVEEFLPGIKIYKLKDQCSWDEENTGELKTIYENGEFYNQTTLTEIRTRIESLI